MIAFIKTITDIDQSIFFFFNGMHNPFWDIVMPLFTRTELWSVLYLTLIFFIIKKYRTKALIILIGLALVILISDQFSVFVKEMVKRLRPTHDPAIQHLVHNIHSKGGLYGFFSSHATNTFAVAMFTSKLFKNYRYSLLIFTWALLVSYTRIYIGLHYPLDILTGIIVGILIGYFIYKLMLFTENRFFIIKNSKIAESGLNNQEVLIIFLVLVIFITIVLLTVNRILHYQLT